MARVDVTTQAMPLAGLVPVLTAPTVDGDVVDVGRCFLYVAAGATAVTVTIETPETVDGDLAITDRVVNVASNATAMIPLTSTHYRQLTTTATQTADVGRAYVDYSNETTVTRAVVSL